MMTRLLAAAAFLLASALPAAAQQVGYTEIKVYNQTTFDVHVICMDLLGPEEGWLEAPPGSSATCKAPGPLRARVRVQMAENAGWRDSCEARAQPDWKTELVLLGRSRLFLQCRRSLDPSYDAR